MTNGSKAIDEVCPICGGMGIVGVDVPVGHPDFGRAFPCVCQTDNIKRRKAAQLRTISNLDAYQNKTFGTFEIDHSLLEENEQYLKKLCVNAKKSRPMTPEQWSQVKASLEEAYRYAQDPHGWLLFWGAYGTGKTHLAAAIGNFRLDEGEPVLFMTAPDLLDHLKATFGPTSEIAYDELFERMREAPLLILDDLGAEKQSDWAQEKLYQLLNHRHVRRLPTVITTNIPLERIEPRVRSRLTDNSLTRSLRLELPDRRSGMTTWQEMDLTNLVRYRDMTFDSFSIRADEGLTDVQSKRLTYAVQSAHAYAHDPQGWLVLTGEPGSGKTHLAAAIAHERKAHGDQTLFVTTSELLDHLRVTFYPGSPVSFDKRLAEIKGARMVVFDDLTIDRNLSPWARDKLFEILLYRFDQYLPTLITTYQALDDMDPRLRSRVTNESRSEVIAMGVPSYSGKPNKRRAAPPRARPK